MELGHLRAQAIAAAQRMWACGSVWRHMFKVLAPKPETGHQTSDLNKMGKGGFPEEVIRALNPSTAARCDQVC